MVLLLFLWSSINAQTNVRLSGYVTASESGECLIGAVVVSGKDWAVTNQYGFYSLSLKTGDNTVQCAYLGRRVDDLRIKIIKDTLVNFVMSPSESLKGAVVESLSSSHLPSSYMGVMEIPVSYILETPSVFGEPDLMKTLQKMPGVQPGMSGFSGIYVRGGGAEENLVLMDGTPLYNASHLLGLFSTFTPEAVKRVTLYKGFFPAKYGGRTSSVIDVRTNEGNNREVKGAVSVGLLNSRVHVEGPIVNDKTTFSLSARGTNTITLLPLTKLLDSPYSYYFYDVTGKLTRRFGNSDRLSLSLYHGRDRFTYSKSLSSTFSYMNEREEWATGMKISDEKYDLPWGNTVAAIRWNHHFRGRVFSDLSVSWSDYQMRENTNHGSQIQQENSQSGQVIEFSNYSKISDLNAVWDFEFGLSSHHRFNFGLSHIVHTFSPEKEYTQHITDAGEPSARAISFANGNNISMSGRESAVYMEDELDYSSFKASVGLRATLFSTEGRFYPSIEPRISAEYRLHRGLSIKSAYSRMSQYVHLLASGTMSLPTDLWVPISSEIKPVISNHYSLGLFYSSSDKWNVSLEAYYKNEYNVLEYKDGQLVFTSATDWEQTVEMGEGSSKGVELFVQKTTGRLTGTIGYTLSKTDRRFSDGTINNGKPFPFTYDRRHVLDCVACYKFNENVSINGSWTFSSGNMITTSWRSTVLLGPDGTMGHTAFISGRNNYRLPASHRLDVSAEFRRRKAHGERMWSFGVCNLYGAMNPDWVVSVNDFVQDENGRTGLTHRLSKRSFLVFLPSVSYAYSF